MPENVSTQPVKETYGEKMVSPITPKSKMENRETKAAPKFSSFLKGLKVLEFVGNSTSPKGILQISQKTGIEKSAVQRIVNSLTQTGYFIQDLQTRKYRIGPKALQLGYGYLVTSPLVNTAMPHLFHLSEIIDEPFSLSVVLENKMVSVYRVRKNAFHHSMAFLGECQPIYCTASGRVILAHLPRHEAEAILKSVDRKKLTPATKIDLEEIYAELDVAHAKGYAVQEDEFTMGEVNFAAPIFDQNGRPIAAIVIGVLKSKTSNADLEAELTPALLNTAFAISKATSLN